MSRHRIGFWYRLAAVLLKPPLLLFFKRRWQGMENIPEDGGFITVVNHNSVVDPLSYAHFQYNTGRVPRFLAKDSLFKSGFVGTVMRGTGQIPVYRESADAAGAFRAAVAAIGKGECVAFYPEGTLTRDPGMWPMQGKTGAARVALATRAPVIPVAQWGANLAVPPYPKRKDIALFPRKTLVVRAGRPIDLSEFYDQEPTSAVLRAVTDRILDEITALLAEIRGEEAPAERFDYRKTLAEQRRGEHEAVPAPGGDAQARGKGPGAGRKATGAEAAEAATDASAAEPAQAAEAAREAQADAGAAAAEGARADGGGQPARARPGDAGQAARAAVPGPPAAAAPPGTPADAAPGTGGTSRSAGAAEAAEGEKA